MFPFAETFARVEDAFHRERVSAYFDRSGARRRRDGRRARTHRRRVG